MYIVKQGDEPRTQKSREPQSDKPCIRKQHQAHSFCALEPRGRQRTQSSPDPGCCQGQGKVPTSTYDYTPYLQNKTWGAISVHIFGCTTSEVLGGSIGNQSYSMSPLDLLPMLHIVGLRGLYISTYMYVTQPGTPRRFIKMTSARKPTMLQVAGAPHSLRSGFITNYNW